MSLLFPKMYDLFMNPLENRAFKKIRSELLMKAEGKVIEIGSGTGINFPLYQAGIHVTAIEPNQQMSSRSEERKNQASVPIQVLHESAEEIPFRDNSYDTVVATLVFCTIPNVEKAMDEMRRVCKPGGKILLFEHVLLKNSFLANLQHTLTPVWKKICDGCHLNRDIIKMLETNGFQIEHVKHSYRGLFVSIEITNKK